jgi:CDP-diacylglycerol--glycerol-3-phosphate 3-phosphatidyltransferase
MNRLFTIPDVLTNFRFALIPVLIVLFSLKQTPTVEVYSFIIFTVAAMNDFIHRRVAKHYNVETILGKLMDPLADKVLVATALIMLIPLGKITAWVCLLIICREIIVTGLRNIAATTGKEVSAGSVGNLKKNFQYFGLGLLIFPLNVVPVPYQYEIGAALVYISLFLALWSGTVYWYNVRSVFRETTR